MAYSTHESLRHDLPAYALGSLSVGEAAEVERHLDACEECRSALREYEEVMRLLPHALPIVEPSPSARAALLSRVQGNGQTGRRFPRARRAATHWYAFAAAAILLLATVTVAMWDQSGNDPAENPIGLVDDLRGRETVQMLAMTGSEHAPAAVGQIIVDPGDTRAALMVSGLPALPSGYEYQFWFVQPDNTRVSGGVFRVDANGSAIVAIDAPREFSRAWRCGVTEEPAGGSPAPTGRNVLSASYYEPVDTDYPDPG
jgi:anti-sigma-K factor RskA